MGPKIFFVVTVFFEVAGNLFVKFFARFAAKTDMSALPETGFCYSIETTTGPRCVGKHEPRNAEASLTM